MKQAALHTILAALALAATDLPLRAEEQAPALTGTWRGSYVCLQGETGLTLTIDKQSGSSVSGYFHFYPPISNPLAKEGCFSVRGEIDGQRRLKLDAVRWIARPEGYLMVGLDGRLDDSGLAVSGTVVAPPPIGSGCAAFEVERIRSDAEIAPLCKGPELLSLRSPNRRPEPKGP